MLAQTLGSIIINRCKLTEVNGIFIHQKLLSNLFGQYFLVAHVNLQGSILFLNLVQRLLGSQRLLFLLNTQIKVINHLQENYVRIVRC